MKYYIYILSNKKNGTLYFGVTGNLVKRIHEHKENIIEGFTKTYAVHTLVYFEQADNINEAIIREKQLKKWNRQLKISLIEKENPHWIDLYNQII